METWALGLIVVGGALYLWKRRGIWILVTGIGIGMLIGIVWGLWLLYAVLGPAP